MRGPKAQTLESVHNALGSRLSCLTAVKQSRSGTEFSCEEEAENRGEQWLAMWLRQDTDPHSLRVMVELLQDYKGGG